MKRARPRPIVALVAAVLLHAVVLVAAPLLVNGVYGRLAIVPESAAIPLMRIILSLGGIVAGSLSLISVFWTLSKPKPWIALAILPIGIPSIFLSCLYTYFLLMSLCVM